MTHPIEHDLFDRDDGLAHCKVCGGAEGSLPTDCPGQRMTEKQEDSVMFGSLDFLNGQWVETANSISAFISYHGEQFNVEPGTSRALEIKSILEASRFQHDPVYGASLKSKAQSA